jgi:hypothetical protein
MPTAGPGTVGTRSHGTRSSFDAAAGGISESPEREDVRELTKGSKNFLCSDSNDAVAAQRIT